MHTPIDTFATEIEAPQEQQEMSFSTLLTFFSTMLEPCFREENRNKLRYVVGAVVLASASILIFSTAFSTCGTISLYNKTFDTIWIQSVAPLGTTKSKSLLGPYSTLEAKLNGWDHLRLSTDAGEFLWTDYGVKGQLSDGESNKALTQSVPFVFFWTCNYQYGDSKDNVNMNPSSVRHLRGANDAEALPETNLVLGA